MKRFLKVDIKAILGRFKRLPVEKKFLAIISPFVFLFVFTIPALQGWDEATHFLRAYQISEGDFLPDRFGEQHAGDMTPVDIVDLHDSAIADLMQSAATNLERKATPGFYITYIMDNSPANERIEKYFEGSAVYSPVSYVPQSVGILVARTLNFPLLLYIFLGRILSAAAFLAIVYWAIKVIPRGKWAIFMIAALPTSITAAATLSPDTIINAGALLLVAYFVRGMFAGKLSNRELILVLATVTAISLTKQSYFLFSLLFLFLPAVRGFGSVKRYLMWNGIIIVIGLGLTLLWYSLINDIASDIAIAHKPDANIDTSSQISHILSNPFRYLGMLLEYFITKSNPIYNQMAGVLTWKGIVAPLWVTFIAYSGLLISFLYERSEMADVRVRISRYWNHAFIMGPILILLSTFVLIYTALYLTFNPVGSQTIEGVQGRYFIPLIPLLLPFVLLIPKRNKPAIIFNSEKTQALLAGIVLFQCIATFIIVFATNFIPGIQFV